jgi:translocation and assembly module TamB
LAALQGIWQKSPLHASALCRICCIMEEEHSEIVSSRRIKKRHIFGAVLLLLLVLLAFAWWQRATIADRFIRDELEKTGVRASYTIEDIGLRTQRLSNVVLGDPANPDFKAKSVEIDLIIGFGQPAVEAVRANGVRLNGRFADGKLYLGELDKFRDMESKEPLKLPDLNVVFSDTVLSLATPWGGVGLAAEGGGNIRNRFNGKLALRSRALAGQGCAVQVLRFDGAVQIRNARPEFDGPIGADAVNCAAQKIALKAPQIDGKVQLTESFDRWIGDVALNAASATLGSRSASGVSGKLSFNGSQQRTEYRFALAKAALRSPEVSAQKLSGDADGTVGYTDAGLSLAARGQAAFVAATLPPSMLPSMDRLVKGTQSTPVGPVVAKLAPALQAATRRIDGSFDFDFGMVPAGSKLVLQRLALRTGSGAKFTQLDPLVVANGQLTSPISLSLAGGGLPEGQMLLRPKGNGWAGTLSLQPYAANGGSVTIPKLAFEGGGSQPLRFTGQATLTGPLLGGMVEGLSLPIDGTWQGSSFAMNSACTNVRYAGLKTGAMRLPAGSLRACPQRGSILQVDGRGTRFALSIPSLALAGSLGSSPMRVNGSGVSFDIDRGFAASNVGINLGAGDSASRFTLARIDGKLAGPGINGTLSGGDGQIGNVPLVISDANGAWRWQGGVLGLDGRLFVSDAAQVARFSRLSVPDMQLTLENNQISAIGRLVEPDTGTAVADSQIMHNLSNSTGNALLAVNGLQFNDRLQPDKLTPLTLGAIANVYGRVSGDGRIDWNAQGVRSNGRFTVAPTDLAAAFGPVNGFSTEIVFSDLLGMVTEPGQVARLATVNPGVPVLDGVVRYQLLPDQKVQIEGGRWPFYGGELILEPTVLDFDVEAKRQLTFRMVGMDAQKFLGGYDLENLQVSGIFDGTLPMVFDQEGGRIVGGWLVSRKGGGEVSYLGPLAYENMGTMANFAFEALRSIRFDEMQIGVDGNIGGEVVTEVRFRGLQQGSTAERNFITKQLAKLPIEFNVRIQAEFLSLIGSLRGIYDAEYAAQRYQSYLEPAPPVTGEETASDKK